MLAAAVENFDMWYSKNCYRRADSYQVARFDEMTTSKFELGFDNPHSADRGDPVVV
jgi:hypothetical protein